ncbi:MAG: hypothetical protein AAGA96_08180 [Verrucomicrobiota bacterium]
MTAKKSNRGLKKSYEKEPLVADSENGPVAGRQPSAVKAPNGSIEGGEVKYDPDGDEASRALTQTGLSDSGLEAASKDAINPSGSDKKGAILARMSESVREIENRTLASEQASEPESFVDDEAPEHVRMESESSTGDGASATMDAVLDPESEVTEGEPLPKSLSEAPGEIHAEENRLEAVKPEATEADSSQPARGVELQVGDEDAESRLPSSWRSHVNVRRRLEFSYGKVFFLCFLIPAVVVLLIGFLARGAIRDYFVGDIRAAGEGEERGSLMESKLEALETKLDEMGKRLDDTVRRVSESVPNVDQELDYLRVRNQLTSFADDAITMANRSQYENLWEVVYDDSQSDFHAAAVSEILRVKFFYASGSRLGAWILPVSELFPGLENESELEVKQVIDLLTDRTQDWRVRVRAARLLEGQRTRTVFEALRGAIHEDPNLDVLKESVRTFEVNAGFVGDDFFDVKSVDAWWEANAERLDAEGQ